MIQSFHLVCALCGPGAFSSGSMYSCTLQLGLACFRPQRLKFRTVSRDQFRLSQDQQVLVVLLFGFRGPVIAPGQQNAVVEEGELVVHFGPCAVTAMRQSKGEAPSGQKPPRGLAFLVLATVKDQADADSALLGFVERPRQTVAREAVESRVE